MIRTMFNCGLIKNMIALSQKPPKQIGEKCEGYNTKYYSPSESNSICDKCKINLKYCEVE